MKERTITVNVIQNCTHDELVTLVAEDIVGIIKAKGLVFEERREKINERKEKITNR